MDSLCSPLFGPAGYLTRLILRLIPEEELFVFSLVEEHDYVRELSKSVTFEQAVKHAALTGWVEGLDALVRHFPTVPAQMSLRWDHILCAGTVNGHLEIVKRATDAGAEVSLYSDVVCAASYRGHNDVVRFLVSRSKEDPRNLFEETGNLELLHEFKEVRYDPESEHTLMTCGRGYIHSWLPEYGDPPKCTPTDCKHVAVIRASTTGVPATPNELEYALVCATIHNHVAVIAPLVELGARTLDRALSVAADNNSCAAIRELVRLGATKIDDALVRAAGWGKIEAMRELQKLGATSYDEALLQAANNGKFAAVLQASLMGATNYLEGLEILTRVMSLGELAEVQALVEAELARRGTI